MPPPPSREYTDPVNYLESIGANRALDQHPKDIPAEERAREHAEEVAKALRDNPIANYRQALEVWGFRWERRLAGWRHKPSGSIMTGQEFAKSGLSREMMLDREWEEGAGAWLWAQGELRMAFTASDIATMFPGPSGPRDFWHHILHEVAKRQGIPECQVCGEALGPPKSCDACGRELRSGKCPHCSMVLMATG